MITLEIVACGKVQVSRQIDKDDIRLMGTLRLMRETKLAVKRSRGRPPKTPHVVQKLKLKPSHNSDDEPAEDEDNDASASIRSETENDDSDESDDKFLKNLERKKAEQIDLEKMTRR
jgi:hypothetical protein